MCEASEGVEVMPGICSGACEGGRWEMDRACPIKERSCCIGSHDTSADISSSIQQS